LGKNTISLLFLNETCRPTQLKLK